MDTFFVTNRFAQKDMQDNLQQKISIKLILNINKKTKINYKNILITHKTNNILLTLYIVSLSLMIKKSSFFIVFSQVKAINAAPSKFEEIAANGTGLKKNGFPAMVSYNFCLLSFKISFD